MIKQSYFEEFKDILKLDLNNYIGSLGFDVVMLDGVIGVPDGVSTRDYLKSIYGSRIVEIIEDILSGSIFSEVINGDLEDLVDCECGDFAISLYNGGYFVGTENRSGYICYPFAAHKEGHATYIITHLPTGLHVGDVKGKDKALRQIKAYSNVDGMNTNDPTFDNLQKLKSVTID